jgi:hypothetical protein
MWLRQVSRTSVAIIAWAALAMPVTAAPWVLPGHERLRPTFERPAAHLEVAKLPLHLPSFTKTGRGRQGDPVNLLLASTESELRSMFVAAGWVGADPVSVGSLFRVLDVLLDASQSYPTAPMSDLYLFGRRQDLGYQKNNCGGRERDHLRIWQTPGVAADGRPWWAIAATRDIDIKWSDGLPTHRIAPNIDVERLLVARDLLATSHVAHTYLLNAVTGGFHGVNGEHDPYETDGDVQVLESASDGAERAVRL